MKPLLLIDVDGVLNAMGPGPGDEMRTARVDGIDIRYSVHTRERLLKLAEHFHLVWATAWETDANKFLCPLWLIDELPVIPFPIRWDREGDTWKLQDIRAFVKDQPFAWIDDDIGRDAHRWGDEREEPTLLLNINPSWGLAQAHVDQLIAFALHAC